MLLRKNRCFPGGFPERDFNGNRAPAARILSVFFFYRGGGLFGNSKKVPSGHSRVEPDLRADFVNAFHLLQIMARSWTFLSPIFTTVVLPNSDAPSKVTSVTEPNCIDIVSFSAE